jgi:hypothetical protein
LVRDWIEAYLRSVDPHATGTAHEKLERLTKNATISVAERNLLDHCLATAATADELFGCPDHSVRKTNLDVSGHMMDLQGLAVSSGDRNRIPTREPVPGTSPCDYIIE